MFDWIAFSIIGSFIDQGGTEVTLGNRSLITMEGQHLGLQASITISNRKILWRLVVVPNLVFGEAYLGGQLTMSENGLEPTFDLLMNNSNSWATHRPRRALCKNVGILSCPMRIFFQASAWYDAATVICERPDGGTDKPALHQGSLK